MGLVAVDNNRRPGAFALIDGGSTRCGNEKSAGLCGEETNEVSKRQGLRSLQLFNDFAGCQPWSAILGLNA